MFFFISVQSLFLFLHCFMFPQCNAVYIIQIANVALIFFLILIFSRVCGKVWKWNLVGPATTSATVTAN